MKRPGPYHFAFACLLLLAACARPELTGLSQPVPEARIARVFIATQRQADQYVHMFGQERSAQTYYGAMDVSIPPTHRTGGLERTSGVADANRFFAPVAAERYDDVGALTAGLRRARAGDGGLVLFVHGYNNTLEDAAFRLAQIREDFGIEEPGLAFVWPSAGDARGYIYDRDSTLFARDGFEQLLRDLRASGQRRVLLVAHSMGSYLAMETLRQIAIKGDRKIFDMLEGVVLMAPDIDPDVFRQQAQAIGPLPQPFIIMTSQRDKVLSIAGLLTGLKPRLGRIESPEEVAGLGVTVIDFSELDDAPVAGGGHDAGFTSPKAIRLLKGLETRIRGGGGQLRDYVLLGKDRALGGLLPQ